MAGNIRTWRQQADTDAVLWRYGYDAADQLTSAVKETTDPTPVVLKRYAYGYDPAGNRRFEQIDDAVTSWTYDALNRLMTQHGGGELRFAGTVSEPATVTVAGHPASVTAANAFSAGVPTTVGTNRVTITATDPSGNVATATYEIDITENAKSFTFDANGNLTSDGTRTFEWEARNQLVAVTVGAHRSEFTYDGQQRRVKIVEKENGVTQSDTKVVWCQSEICEERAADGTTVTRRAFKQDEQVAGAARFFATDHLGSVNEVTDSTSTVLAAYAFDPWGRWTTTAGTDITNTGFTGHRWEPGTALALTLYRAYDAELGRWISEDPKGLAAGPNLSAYVENSPIGSVDPFGLQLYKPGPPPIQIVPAGCSAGPWQFVNHGEYSRYRTKWALTRTWNVSLIAPGQADGGMGSAPFLGACFCEWTQVGILKVTTAWELWKRTVTCCSQTSDQYATTEREFERQVPSIGPTPGVKAVTAGQYYGGSCHCREP